MSLISECSLQNSEYYIRKKRVAFVLFKNGSITSICSISLGPHLFQLFVPVLFLKCCSLLFLCVFHPGVHIQSIIQFVLNWGIFCSSYRLCP
jgi:hypothetical protein